MNYTFQQHLSWNWWNKMLFRIEKGRTFVTNVFTWIFMWDIIVWISYHMDKWTDKWQIKGWILDNKAGRHLTGTYVEMKRNPSQKSKFWTDVRSWDCHRWWPSKNWTCKKEGWWFPRKIWLEAEDRIMTLPYIRPV